MKKLLCLLASLLLFSLPIAANTSQSPLPVDQAFALSAQLFGQDTIALHWKIAPKHYLYRDRLHFKIIKPTDAQIGTILFPKGIPKENDIFGKYEVYFNEVTIPVPIAHASPNDHLLEVAYQGCAEDGYCYPPTTRQLQIDFNKSSITIINPSNATTKAITPPNTNIQEKPFFDLFSDHHIITLLLAFLGFGILLSFTPCVLPMIPILSGIIVGHEKTVLRGKSFRLSLIYVLSMAITYAIAGMLVGWLGGSVQTVFQQPWVIILFSLLFVLLALSFFGFYSLKLPAHLEERIANISRHQKSGHYLGVMIMGCLATLIVSPCVTPALVGVLGYISKTGNALLGGAALFMLGLGMGFPLLLIGLVGRKFLPKAGAWMNIVEHSFGVLFLGMAIWMLDRIIPAPLALMLWSSLLVICSVYLGALSPTPPHGWGKLFKGIGFVMLLYGFLLAAGAAQGNGNLLQPLSFSVNTTQNTASFAPVKNLSELQAALTQAKILKKPVLVDFYADWCLSCREMENTTFKDAAVIAALNNFVVLKADITANDAGNKILMQHFQVIAPPTFLLFDSQGEQIKNLTRVGKIDTPAFLDYLKQVQ
jgi:thiol:disulfide interchange protein DsbD